VSSTTEDVVVFSIDHGGPSVGGGVVDVVVVDAGRSVLVDRRGRVVVVTSSEGVASSKVAGAAGPAVGAVGAEGSAVMVEPSTVGALVGDRTAVLSSARSDPGSPSMSAKVAIPTPSARRRNPHLRRRSVRAMCAAMPP
jgi:hypothetical protein